ISLRLTDDAQNVACRGLLVERRGQLPVARLQLLEQPHVLDGDDSLVGEGTEQGDLAVGEPSGFYPPNTDHAERDTISKHRDSEATPKADRTANLMLVFGVEFNVGYVDFSALEDRPAG